jgi:hypothetical protein
MSSKINDLFKENAGAFENRRSEALRLKRETEERESIRQKELEANQKRKMEWLIQQAQQTIVLLLADKDSEFSKYLVNVFKKNGRHFDDMLGICGFKRREMEWKNTGTESTLLAGQSVEIEKKELVGELSDYIPHIRIITLYEEKRVKTPETRTFCECDVIGPGRSSSETQQILALAVETKFSFSEISLDKLKNARIVHLSETSCESPLIWDYSEANPVSFDRGFIDALLELVSPETAIRLFLERFGSPKDKEPEY